MAVALQAPVEAWVTQVMQLLRAGSMHCWLLSALQS